MVCRCIPTTMVTQHRYTRTVVCVCYVSFDRDTRWRTWNDEVNQLNGSACVWNGRRGRGGVCVE
jgi:hypothetical protein